MLISKKLYLFIFLLVVVLLLVGCVPKSNTDSVEVSIPTGAVVACEDNEIDLGVMMLSLPDGVAYGVEETDDGVVYYAWKSETEYIMPRSLDVMFYIYKGEDNTSPDKVITNSEAKTSIAQNYMQIFRNTVDNGRLVIDSGLAATDKWYTLCFTGISGKSITTTYNTLCYPKTYYGIYMLQADITDTYSRNYYGFVFSNDATGDMLTEKEYSSLLRQIKDGFGVEKFFTIQQNELNYNPDKDFSQGYSYTQLTNLFINTSNYHIITASREEDIEDTVEQEIKES